MLMKKGANHQTIGYVYITMSCAHMSIYMLPCQEVPSFGETRLVHYNVHSPDTFSQVGKLLLLGTSP